MTEPTHTAIVGHIMELKEDLGEMRGILDTVVTAHGNQITENKQDISHLKKWRTAAVASITTLASVFGISLKL